MAGEIVTAHEATLLDRDIIAERSELRANQAAIVALARRTQAPYCGMTSRPAPYHRIEDVQWGSYVPPVPMVSRMSCTEVVNECVAWARWLHYALGIVRWGPRGNPIPIPLREVSERAVPAPPGRTFTAEVWPGLARGPEPRKGRR